MIETLISSKTRIKLLLKFFLNSNTTGYLRNLESEFGESTNAIRLELNKFEKAGLLASSIDGNKKIFKAETSHPLFSDIHSIVKKYIGIDKIINEVVGRIGNLEKLLLVGDFAMGIDSRIIDLVVVGNIDHQYLFELINKAESLVKRKVRYITFTTFEFATSTEYNKENALVLWEHGSEAEVRSRRAT